MSEHKSYHLTHLEQLEAESIYVMREVAAQFERPALLFSGGKDSIIMVRLAQKAFWPAKLPFVPPLREKPTKWSFSFEVKMNLIPVKPVWLLFQKLQMELRRFPQIGFRKTE